ncbi:hypothetical protein C8Q80DRAFT_305598 [Daedaleopsis nitida]|nr:hypothetical protein C8Q80DRAFT_305598 [Daedaleopsis nitida]
MSVSQSMSSTVSSLATSSTIIPSSPQVTFGGQWLPADGSIHPAGPGAAVNMSFAGSGVAVVLGDVDDTLETGCMRCSVDDAVVAAPTGPPTLTFCATQGLPSGIHTMRVGCQSQVGWAPFFLLHHFVVFLEPVTASQGPTSADVKLNTTDFVSITSITPTEMASPSPVTSTSTDTSGSSIAAAPFMPTVTSPAPSLAPSPAPAPSSQVSNRKSTLVGSVSGGVLLCAVGLVLFAFYRRARRACPQPLSVASCNCQLGGQPVRSAVDQGTTTAILLDPPSINGDEHQRWRLKTAMRTYPQRPARSPSGRSGSSRDTSNIAELGISPPPSYVTDERSEILSEVATSSTPRVLRHDSPTLFSSKRDRTTPAPQHPAMPVLSDGIIESSDTQSSPYSQSDLEHVPLSLPAEIGEALAYAPPEVQTNALSSFRTLFTRRPERVADAEEMDSRMWLHESHERSDDAAPPRYTE